MRKVADRLRRRLTTDWRRCKSVAEKSAILYYPFDNLLRVYSDQMDLPMVLIRPVLFSGSRYRRGLFLLILLAVLSACSRTPPPITPLGQPTFALYQQETTHWVEQHRHFQTLDKALELTWNTPSENRPADTARKGILLVHGLGDSPGSFTDIIPALTQRGFLVRTVLLPGHGTQPADLMPVSVEDWRRVVAEQATLLREEVGEVYLGGFSTGGNLVLEYALQHPEIQGLVLFSPAIRSDEPLDFLAPLLATVTDWLRPPRPGQPQQIATRYLRVPTNGFAQFYYSSASVRHLLAKTPYNKPVLMVLAQHDSVLDTAAILGQFDKAFPHPASRVIWYGNAPAQPMSERVLVRTDRLPEWRISQFSHMSVLFSPDNPLYGRTGTLRLCSNGPETPAANDCKKREDVWYSDWGYQEQGKTHIRLTFNPYFDWQNQIMASVLNSESVATASP